MSYKPEVQTDKSGKWYDNALRFETEREARAYAADMARRWYAVEGTRAAKSEDPVNYRWNDDKQLLEAVDAPKE